MLEYRNVADLDRVLLSNLGRFREHADLIVGIPRSGMLPAVLLALHLDMPVMDLDSYCRGAEPEGGMRLQQRRKHSASVFCTGGGAIPTSRRVLVIDDSLLTGASMAAAKKRIASSLLGTMDQIKFAAVYIHPEHLDLVDIWLEQLPRRIFEWNVLNNTVLSNSCMDIDGVLCRDPTEDENDDGSAYECFIETVAPLRVPAFEVCCLVTCRLERYRARTEAWLRANGIRYRNLVMMDLPSKQARLASGSHARFKARVYEGTGCSLFIESDLSQAREIAHRCRKPVYCSKTGEMFYHNDAAELLERERRLRKAGRVLRPFVPKPLRSLARRMGSRLGIDEQ